MMMKNSIILIILGTCILLFSSLAVQASQHSFGPAECCFKFYDKRLPKRGVVNCTHTDNLCPMQGVLLTMKNGGQFCVDPSVDWVKDIIKAKGKNEKATASN